MILDNFIRISKAGFRRRHFDCINIFKQIERYFQVCCIVLKQKHFKELYFYSLSVNTTTVHYIVFKLKFNSQQMSCKNVFEKL